MCELNIIRERRGSFLRLGRRFGAMHSKQKSKPCGRHGMTGALMDRIKAHRSAPDVYDPPTLDQMANRIEELEAKLAKAVDALEAGVICTTKHGGAAEFLRIARATLAELKGQDDE
jgi:hypothetical protein